MCKVTKADCVGCRNNFYNGNNSLGVSECWSFKDAKLESKLDIHIDVPPPYKHLKPTERPNCYTADRYVRVEMDRLSKDGFWK